MASHTSQTIEDIPADGRRFDSVRRHSVNCLWSEAPESSEVAFETGREGAVRLDVGAVRRAHEGL